MSESVLETALQRYVDVHNEHAERAKKEKDRYMEAVRRGVEREKATAKKGEK